MERGCLVKAGNGEEGLAKRRLLSCSHFMLAGPFCGGISGKRAARQMDCLGGSARDPAVYGLLLRVILRGCGIPAGLPFRCTASRWFRFLHTRHMGLSEESDPVRAISRDSDVAVIMLSSLRSIIY